MHNTNGVGVFTADGIKVSKSRKIGRNMRTLVRGRTIFSGGIAANIPKVFAPGCVYKVRLEKNTFVACFGMLSHCLRFTSRDMIKRGSRW